MCSLTEEAAQTYLTLYVIEPVRPEELSRFEMDRESPQIVAVVAGL
jgi:hypothetical protein